MYWQHQPKIRTSLAAVDGSADIKTMFTLAAEKYPTIFVNNSDWSSFRGFIYRFFASSGVSGASLTPTASVAAQFTVTPS
jgi:hypothetical protein